MNRAIIRKSISRILLTSTFICLISLSVSAQKTDTLLITAKSINAGVLKEGTTRYLVYFKMKKDATRTQTQFWTRNITYSNFNGTNAVTITQEWEDKDSIVHTSKSICDAKTLHPIYHETWWKQRGLMVVDYANKAITNKGVAINEQDTAKQRKKIWNDFKVSWDKYFLNWHIDLEIFSVLPYKNKVTFLIPFTEPGATAPENVAYTVTGSAKLTGYDNQQIDCWLLMHEEKGNKEVFWISKKTKEVLKLEQEINGTMYRYKVKLGFSM